MGRGGVLLNEKGRHTSERRGGMFLNSVDVNAASALDETEMLTEWQAVNVDYWYEDSSLGMGCKVEQMVLIQDVPC